MRGLFVYDIRGQREGGARDQRWEVRGGRKPLFYFPNSISHFRQLIFSNEKGFLLLEHLISVVIVGVLSIAFLSLIQVVRVYTANQTALTMHEVNTLAVRLQNEIRFAQSLSAADGRLFAHFTDGRVVSYSAQNDRLVRQVDGIGGEIMVYNLAAMDVVLFDSRSAQVSLKSFDGGIFQFYLEVFRLEVNLALDYWLFKPPRKSISNYSAELMGKTEIRLKTACSTLFENDLVELMLFATPPVSIGNLLYI